MKIDYNTYDFIIVAFSGGKDSTACFLNLLEQNVPKSKIELWHHLVDGKGLPAFMDWECTEDYCRKFAQHFKVPIYFSWKSGGFKQEMLRDNSPTSRTFFEVPEYELKNNYRNYISEPGQPSYITVGGESNRLGTRLQFPQVSPNLNVRWCSAYLKIDVCDKAIKNQERFIGKRVLIISGERAEESTARATYAEFELDRADTRHNIRNKRFVDRYRPVLHWKEQRVWRLIEKYRVVVHPCYYLGYGRCSCKFCIFGNKNQFATSAYLSPKQFKEIVGYEKQFGKTIKRNISIDDLAASGTPYTASKEYMGLLDRQARSKEYIMPIVSTKGWILPAGAYGENDGPQ